MPTTLTSLFTPANLVNGTWSVEGDGTYNTVADKYHGTELAKLPNATEAQMEDAIAAAYASRDALKNMSAEGRSKVLAHLADKISLHELEIVDLIVKEAGKPRMAAHIEVARSITTLRTAAAEALRFGGEMTP
ncbi:MAG: aldehyde dehydrogenase family protein, partial [Flavobacteriales bacterium]|nr:aldehyde dehydrogenase family protein [Flavobacteriales bacterium]